MIKLLNLMKYIADGLNFLYRNAGLMKGLPYINIFFHITYFPCKQSLNRGKSDVSFPIFKKKLVSSQTKPLI